MDHCTPGPLPSLSACSLEMGLFPGTNEATLHPGIREHKRGLGRGAGLGQCGEEQLLIRAGEEADGKPILTGYMCVCATPLCPGSVGPQGLLPPGKEAFELALPPPGPPPFPLTSKMENLENPTWAVGKEGLVLPFHLPSLLPRGERRSHPTLSSV